MQCDLNEKLKQTIKLMECYSINMINISLPPVQYSAARVVMFSALSVCDFVCLLISAPSLGVYYCKQLTLSVCLQIASSFLFLYGIEPFLAVSSP